MNASTGRAPLASESSEISVSDGKESPAVNASRLSSFNPTEPAILQTCSPISSAADIASGRDEADLDDDRGDWGYLVPQRVKKVCQAIIEDDAEPIAVYLREPNNRTRCGLIFPASIETRNGDIINSKAMNLGHLMALFVSAKTLDFLESRSLIPRSIFRRRCDIDLEFVGSCVSMDDGSIEIPLTVYKNVPPTFMTAFRDNWSALEWLLSRQAVLREANGVDSLGRNLLHCCVDEESPRILQELLSNRKLLPLPLLREMLRTQEISSDMTPFMYAVLKPEPLMLMVFLGACTEQFAAGWEDLSGVGTSIINCLLNEITDSALCLQLIKEFLKNGGKPDRHLTDKTPNIETLVANEHFAGSDLRRMVQLLLKYGAKATTGALIQLIQLPFRTDDELLEIAKLLLKHGRTSVLLAPTNFKQWERWHNESRKASPITYSGNQSCSVVIQMFKEKRLSVSTMQKLFQLINQYADISVIFPDADGIAAAISERIAYDPSFDQPHDLENVLDLLIKVATYKDNNAEVSDFLHRVLRGLLRSLFERNDYRKAERPYDKVIHYIQSCLTTIEKLKLDFNVPVDGQIGLFSLFHQGIPDEIIPKIVEVLPETFNINILNESGDNMASLAIKRFNYDFEMILKIFTQLKERRFDFSKKILANETVLVFFVRKCGEVFDQLQTDDMLSSYMEEDFFKIMQFLFNEKIDVAHLCPESKKGGAQENVLSVAMRLSHPTIAEEILKVQPSLLNHVKPEVLLLFLQKCPQVLEFLNGRTMYLRDPEDDSFANNTVDNRQDFVMSRLRPSVSRTVSFADVRATWLNYVQHHHHKLLDLLKEEPERNYAKQVELIYDYLVHCVNDKRTGDPRKIAMEFSVFRNPDHDSEPNKRECVNAELLIKIVETNSPLESHPLFTEYFEKFYRTAFINSLIFIFYHIAFLVALNGCIINVVTPVTNYALYSPIYTSGHHLCHVNRCAVDRLPLKQQRLVHYATDRQANCSVDASRPHCPECLAFTANHSLCSKRHLANHTECPFTMHIHDAWIFPGLHVLLFLATIGLLREALQLLMDPKDYLDSYIQNPIEITMFLFAVLFAINLTDCPMNAGYKLLWQFELGAVAVLDSWILMFLYMSKFPAFATYVIMFTHAVRSGLSLLITFSWLLLGFCFEFHILLGNQLMYRRIYTSLNKVWLMLAGEIDYKDTMTEQYDDPNDDTKELHFEALTRIMLAIFVLLVNIILMNLFIGLIVGDVSQINKEAQTKRWKWNLKFTESIDYLWEFIGVWRRRLNSCCRIGGYQQTAADPLAEEMKATEFILQYHRGVFHTSISKKAGLHVTLLNWKNVFKWRWTAMFFGFVPRHVLIQRLKNVAARKEKLMVIYNSTKRVRNLDQVEGVQKRVVAFPSGRSPWTSVEEHSESESDESIRNDDVNQKRKLYLPDADDDEVAPDAFCLGDFASRHRRDRLVDLGPLLTVAGGHHPIGAPFPRFALPAASSEPESARASPQPPASAEAALGTDPGPPDFVYRSRPLADRRHAARVDFPALEDLPGSPTSAPPPLDEVQETMPFQRVDDARRKVFHDPTDRSAATNDIRTSPAPSPWRRSSSAAPRPSQGAVVGPSWSRMRKGSRPPRQRGVIFHAPALPARNPKRGPRRGTVVDYGLPGDAEFSPRAYWEARVARNAATGAREGGAAFTRR